MPYIDNLADLKILGFIPNAETAKMAIIRPTTHFAIASPDNPNMVKTLALINEKIEKQLASVKNSTVADLALKRESLKQNFLKELAHQASQEQDGLFRALKKNGVMTNVILEDKGELEYYTDQIFATDTGQYFDKEGVLSFIPAYLKNKQRQGEERLAIIQAENMGAYIYPLYSAEGKGLIFEGGDIRQMPGKKLFFIGQGYRSDAETSRALAAISNYIVLPIKLLMEQFYHLDCCFLPLPNDSAVIYEGEYILDTEGHHVLDKNGWPRLVPGSETMASESRSLIRNIYPGNKLVLINKSEALAFATNAAVLQSTKDNRFKMFVNGLRNGALDVKQEQMAISNHNLSYTAEHLAEIHTVTNGLMDIIELPYKTMHSSGGSVRCTVQEVACTTEALKPRKNDPYFYSKSADRADMHLTKNRNFFFVSEKKLSYGLGSIQSLGDKSLRL